MNIDWTPKISIIIPVFNGANYLREAIDSALSQTYQNIEIIVVNDGSKDEGETERIALSYGDKIRYFSKENGGSSSALNVGIANMTGEWFSWLSHDDLYEPDKLEKQIAYIKALNVDASLISMHVFFSASKLIDAEGKVIRANDMKNDRKIASAVESFPHNGYLIAEPTLYYFYGCSCLIHRHVFDDVGCFDESLRLVNDRDMWFRIYSKNYIVHYIPEVLVKCRIHNKQISRSIGFSYHTPEQDMFWERSLNWLLEKCPNEDKLLYLFGRNAYLKTRNEDGDRAFQNIGFGGTKRYILKLTFKCRALIRNFGKKIYLKLKV